MATTDLHAQILPYDYYADAATAPGGLAVLASIVRVLRRGAANSVLLDNGDFLQGNPIADWAAAEGADQPHPVIAAMNALGYDAGTLGNHEFNYGLPFLNKVLAEAGHPVVASNVFRAPGAGEPLARPWVLLDRQVTDTAGRDWPLRIGVIGFAPPQIAQWERLSLGDSIGTCDIVAAARRHLPDLRAAGAEIVVALCHSGIGAEDHTPGMENAAVPLAAIPGIDALIVGHTHGVFPGGGQPATGGIDPQAGTLSGKPAVMAGALGSHLGLIDLLLDRGAAGWRVVGHAVAALPAEGGLAGVFAGSVAGSSGGGSGGGAGTVPVSGPVAVSGLATDSVLAPFPDLWPDPWPDPWPHARVHPAPDPQIAAVTRPAHDRILGLIRRDIGHTPRRIASHFALVRADDSLAIVAQAQAGHARTVLAGTDWADLPILSAVAPFRAGGRGGPQGYLDIPPGPLSLRNAAELYIYPNTVCLIEMTGAAVADWLERSAGLFMTVRPGVTDQPLIDPGFPGYNFDVIFGLTYRIDVTQSPGGPRRRVRNIRWQGRPLAPEARVVVVTNNYRVGGAGGYAEVMARARVIQPVGPTVRDLVIAHLRGTVPAAAGPVWRFAPLPLGSAQTGAWFDTAPGARPTQAPGLALEDLGLQSSGFRRFRLRLPGGRQAGGTRA